MNPSKLTIEQRLEFLEKENIETTNALYELENRLQAQIDGLIETILINRNWEETNDVY